MVWQQLIRLTELWLSNEHPPLWQSSYYVVNHEHTLVRFSIAATRLRSKSQEWNENIRQGRREEGKLKTLWGSFIHVWTFVDHRILASNTRVSLHQKMCFRHFHTVSAWPTVRLCVFATEGSLQDFRVIPSKAQHLLNSGWCQAQWGLIAWRCLKQHRKVKSHAITVAEWRCFQALEVVFN